MTDAPSAILARAADLIRDTAAAATKPPWLIEYDYAGTDPHALFRMDPEHPDDPDHSFSLGGMIYGPDNAWAALMSPAVAPAVEAVLRAAAYDVTIASKVLTPADFKARLEDRFAPALALARAVLGEKEDTDG